MIGLPEDADVRRMRERARLSAALSSSRRARRRPVRDRASDAALGAAAVLTLALLALIAVGGDASARGGGGGARMVDVRAERLLRAWCPPARVMPRRHCVAWMRVAQCETGDPADRGVTYRSLRRIRWRYNGSSGYDGALQFSLRTWRGNVGRVPARRLTRRQFVLRRRGAYRAAYVAPPAVQVLAADALRTRRDGGGLGHWPICGARWQR